MTMRLCCAVLAALLPPAASAQSADAADEARRREASVELRHESLDRGLDDWRALRVGVSSHGRWTTGWHAAFVAEHRFGMSDTALELGGTIPLDDQWMLQVEAGGAADADFLARSFTDARLVRRLDGGWVIGGGLRRSRYSDATVTRASIDVERYSGQWRMAYGHDRVRLHGEAHGHHEIAVDRYFGDRSSIGVRLGSGRDASLRPDGARVAIRTHAAWVRGSRGFGAGWTMDWAIGFVDQAGAYDRTWLQAGVRRTF